MMAVTSLTNARIVGDGPGRLITTTLEPVSAANSHCATPLLTVIYIVAW